MTRSLSLLALLALPACAPNEAALDARIHRLEAEVAQIRVDLADRAASVPATNASMIDQAAGARCVGQR